jgi:hypothetical protein
MMITLLKSTSILTKYSPRLLVVPPASHDYSSKVNHKLQQHEFTIKTQNAVFTQFLEKCVKNNKTKLNCLFSLITICLTTEVVFVD